MMNLNDKNIDKYLSEGEKGSNVTSYQELTAILTVCVPQQNAAIYCKLLKGPVKLQAHETRFRQTRVVKNKKMQNCI